MQILVLRRNDRQPVPFLIGLYFNYNNKKIINIVINSNFTTDGNIKINANYNYSYKDINKFSHIYKFYNNNSKFREIKLDHKNNFDEALNVVNDKFNIQAINSSRINLMIYLVNNKNDNSSSEIFDYNIIQIIYNDDVDASKIDINTDNISSNLDKINKHVNLIAKAKRSGDLALNQIFLAKPDIKTSKTNISSNLEKMNANETNITSLNSKYESILWRSSNNNGLINQVHNKIGVLEENHDKIKEIVKGDMHYILKNIHLLELDFVNNLKLEENNEVLVYEKR